MNLRPCWMSEAFSAAASLPVCTLTVLSSRRVRMLLARVASSTPESALTLIPV